MADFKLRAVEENEPEVKIESSNKEQQKEVAQEVTETTESTEQVQESAQEDVQEDIPKQTEQEPVKDPEPEVSEEDRVRDYLSKYDLDLDKVLSNTEEEKKVELTEDVEAFLKYQKETGRSLNDYMSLSKDYDSMADSDLLRAFIKETKPHFDEEDTSYHIQKNFVSSENEDENIVREKKLALKEELYKAKEFFNTQKEKYYKPLESSDVNVPNEYQEAFSFYSDYKQNQEKQDLLVKKRGEVFQQKTNELYDQIEGFEFDLGEKKQVFKLNDKESIKSQTSDFNNFVSRFVDKEGYLKDPASYHRSMAIANSPDQFAKYFYELGKAEAVDGLVKETKNIDMSVKENVVTGSDGKTKFRAVSEDSGSRLRIRKKS